MGLNTYDTDCVALNRPFISVNRAKDFNFLEDALRCVDGGKRELSKRRAFMESAENLMENSNLGRRELRLTRNETRILRERNRVTTNQFNFA